MIVVSLLAACSREEPAAKPTVQLRLPMASHGQPCPDVVATIAVDPTSLWLQGEILRPTALLADGIKVERFEPLIAPLEKLRAGAKARVALEADASIDQRILKKVIFAANQAGFDELCLVAGAGGNTKVLLPVNVNPPIERFDSDTPRHTIVVEPGGFRATVEARLTTQTGELGDAQRLEQDIRRWQGSETDPSPVYVQNDDGTTYASLIAAVDAAFAARLAPVFLVSIGTM